MRVSFNGVADAPLYHAAVRLNRGSMKARRGTRALPRGGDVSDARRTPAGQDSRTTDWFGQNVDRDTELADELVEEHGAKEAERRFEQLAEGREREAGRRGEQIDPEQGEDAYRDVPS
jgi:hypothetical protein